MRETLWENVGPFTWKLLLEGFPGRRHCNSLLPKQHLVYIQIMFFGRAFGILCSRKNKPKLPQINIQILYLYVARQNTWWCCCSWSGLSSIGMVRACSVVKERQKSRVATTGRKKFLYYTIKDGFFRCHCQKKFLYRFYRHVETFFINERNRTIFILTSLEFSSWVFSCKKTRFNMVVYQMCIFLYFLTNLFLWFSIRSWSKMCVVDI